MRNSNQNEIKVSILCQLKQHLRQNNNDARVIRLSNHEIRFQFRLARECFLLIQNMYLINETERVVISNLQSAVAILTFEIPSSLSNPITYFLA